MKTITVYCAASRRLDQAFHDVAEQVGGEIGRRGLRLVYGGGSVGLMGEVARAARAAGASTLGIITQTLVTMEQADEECDEMIVVETMRERKRLLTQHGDAFLVLPGGIGTYEEMFEVIVGRKLREHDKPIGVVNSHGYYNPFVSLIEHGTEHGFIEESMHELAFVHPDPVTVLDHLAGVRAIARGS
ncbi:MAG: TIGR00730 family Rossman fold protein [Planctomycetes bacterium]|nr:TIGR00730 family Rossman fold protein [Planctomycetota bacterium]